MLNNGNQRRIVYIIGQFDCENLVVKSVVSRHLTGDHSPLRIDHDMIRVHANLMQHSAHQRRFILAISVAV